MPDGINLMMPEDVFRRLTQQADAALENGDEVRCVYLIERIYQLLDNELSI